MNILVTVDGRILLHAPKIVFGFFDEAFEKWALLNEKGEVMMYAIDHGYTVAEVDSLPEDYEEGKYLFFNGMFVLNQEWEPFIPEEQKIDTLARTVAELEEALLLTDETAVALYESQMVQEEINIAQDETLVEIFELIENLL